MSLTQKIREIVAELRLIEQRKKFLLQQLYELKAVESQSEVPSSFSTLEKLQLFNDLFVGRRDVYARGFQPKKNTTELAIRRLAPTQITAICVRGEEFAV